MQKNILFYIPNVDQKSGGVRQYAFNVLNMITESNCRDFNYFIYHENNDELFINLINKTDNFKLITVSKSEKIKLKFKKKINNFLSFLTFKKIIKSAQAIDLLINKYNIQIVHCPFQDIPNTKKAKLISTMHDVQEMHFPEFFTPEERIDRATRHNYLSKKSDAIVVSYDHIKNDIAKYFNVPESKLTTFLISLNNLWIVDYFNNNKIITKTETELYLLYPANAWIHKNHLKLIEAVHFLNNKKIKIILTGDFSSELGKQIMLKINELDLNNQIVLKGILSQEELFQLYMNTHGVVVPTLYEAGSYPLYEAICLEKAVICSNVTSLPETIGNDKFTFDPNDFKDIANKIDLLFNNENFRLASIENSIIMKPKLINNESINKLYLLYQSV
jgi:glycosyltransferase involved in cell wall biosynthesis